MNQITTMPVDLLETAGFMSLAKIEQAKKLGFNVIPQQTVQAFTRKLRGRKQEYSFFNLEDYKGEEIIPTSELQKVIRAKELSIFDKMLLVGTKALKLKRVYPDPLVIGLIIPEQMKKDAEKRGNLLSSEIINQDWFLIAAWK